MVNRLLAAIIACGYLVASPGPSFAAQPAGTHQDLGLSPDLLELLRAEMREIAAGVQGMALSVATANWQAIRATSEQIRASYIMEKKLKPDQAEELARALPAQFKLLDAQFHQRAEKLAAAAQARDPELVVFHYSRLVESCVACHASFAAARFTGFAAPDPQVHHH